MNKPLAEVRERSEELDANRSDNPHFAEIVGARFTRRQAVLGGLAATGAAFTGSLGLVGCSDDKSSDEGSGEPPIASKLGFESIPRSFDDVIKVPAGYRATVLIPWGEPITGSYPPFDPISASNSDAEQAQQVGAHHDGMKFFDFPLGSGKSDEGVLCVNHEYADMTYVHPTGPTVVDGKRPAAQSRKEINVHGVSVVHVRDAGNGRWEVVRSPINRRITGATPMEIRGPVRGSDLVKTKYSPAGIVTRGTLNNCGNGWTPWGTYLTCEENWAGYFVNKGERPPSQSRYGVPSSNGRYSWETSAGDASEVNDEFARFDATTKAEDASGDYRNEPHTFGWIVEIDPYAPTALPRKRTSIGRFGHEGCWVSPRIAGKKLAFYSGDDARNEYVYKFVSAQSWDAADENRGGLAVGDKYFDEGTLYVAKFKADGTGEWLPLTLDNPALAGQFPDLATLLVNTRVAADLAGATKMDRPEWGAVNPLTGEVYMTMTNNTDRAADGVDEANPRGPNRYGHIVRWRENGDDPAATGFVWDIFVFGSRAEGLPADSVDANISGLTALNDFASPDGLWFDARGILWIQSDDTGDYTYGSSSLGNEPLSNNQMLAVIPGQLADITPGADVPAVNPATQTELRRFLVGPKQQEVTGIDMTPDGRTMFINIQHPGERGSFANPGSNWPHPNGDATAVPVAGYRPRSSTVVITRIDGGPIAL